MEEQGNAMMEKEQSWDLTLGIRTVGRDDTNSDEYRYPYEPTPYSVLQRLGYRYPVFLSPHCHRIPSCL